MNKKIIATCFSLLLLTACSSKWDQSDPDMPEELRASSEEALDESLALVQENPENVDGLFGAAFYYQQLGEWKEAVRYYEKVLVLSPTNWATLNNLAYMYETMEDYQKAAEYIKTLYQSDPTGIEAIRDTVRILVKAGDPDNALKALENFSTNVIDPTNPDKDLQDLVSSLYEEIQSSVEQSK
ncbi:MAG: tetratricopeptide repeat protein [Candidatus Margulisiibacteriota bacterium]